MKKDPSSDTSSVSPSKIYSPLFGVSNAYFLTQPPPLKTILENSSNNCAIGKSGSDETKSNFSSTPSSPALPDHLIKDIPNLLSQVFLTPFVLPELKYPQIIIQNSNSTF